MLSIVILIILPFQLIFPGTVVGSLCWEKQDIVNQIDSESVLSVACSNGTASFDIRKPYGAVSDFNIQLDYYCYHLNNMSLFKSETIVTNLQVPNSRQNLYEGTEDVQNNSICVFVCCVQDGVWPRDWYFINGNGSNCSNKVDTSTTPVTISSSIEDHSTTATNNEGMPITESITPSPHYTTYYFTTTANNEWTAITESTTLSGITTTSVGQILSSSYVSEVSSDSVFLTTSDSDSSVTSRSFGIFSSNSLNTNNATDVRLFSLIVIISISILSAFILIFLLSLLAILWCLRRQKSKFNQDLIFGMDHLLKLPEEHLKLTSSTYTICTDPKTCTASHNVAIPASHEVYAACNKSIGTGINNGGLLEVLEKDASYDLQNIHDVLSSRMHKDERQTDNCSKQDMSQKPVTTNPPSVYNEIGYITV